MQWNWQQKGWPQFVYESASLEPFERRFLHSSGVSLGSRKSISQHEQIELIIDLMGIEALKTSEIEGEYLNRDSVLSFLRRNFGLETDDRKVPLAEQGISDMLLDVYRSFVEPLDHQILFNWQKMLLKGRQDLQDIGAYRTHKEPMQIVSGAIVNPKIYFEAPRSQDVSGEMARFISWFNQTAPQGPQPLPALMRAGIAHLYFVSIHPFEDGNGRVGRALVEKCLAQSLGQPTLIALSHTIQKHKRAYYDALEQNNKELEITPWLLYFAETILLAQTYTQRLIDFLIEKTKFYDKMRGLLNVRQEKVVARLFHEGPEGFKGGLSAEKYISITQAARATVTRDLQDLVSKKCLIRTGELKGTRYVLNIPWQKQH
jgi:Fic family protein